MSFFFNTVYFLRKSNRFDGSFFNSSNPKNQNIIYINYNDLILKGRRPSSILENSILNKQSCLFLLDFKEVSDTELLTFLISYYKNSEKHKNPIIILNKSKKTTLDNKIFKNIKYLNFIHFLILKHGLDRKIIIKKIVKPIPKKNKYYILGFSIFNLLSFIFMAFFGSTTQYVQMSALLESMTYFMNNQPEYSRIHAILNEQDISNDRLSDARRNFYSLLQKKIQSFNSKGSINSYFLPGTNQKTIIFNAHLIDYEKNTYSFETKILNQSAYSNQGRILMEKIDLEQYLIKDYSFHTPLNGADYVYYMASNVADYLINLSADDDINSYSDLIGKIMVISYEENGFLLEQKLSINNIFYTTKTTSSLGEPPSNNEYINYYSGKDRGYGEYLLNSLGNFGVSTTTTPHRYFGSVFCFDFFGQNKLLKIVLDECMKEALVEDFKINFYFNKRPIGSYDIFLDEINHYYKNGYLFSLPKYYLLSLSIITFVCGSILFFWSSKENIRHYNERIIIKILIIISPFLVMQFSLLLWIVFSNYSLFSISAMNVFGSGFSLVITTCLFVYFIFNNKNESVYKIEI